MSHSSSDNEFELIPQQKKPKSPQSDFDAVPHVTPHSPQAPHVQPAGMTPAVPDHSTHEAPAEKQQPPKREKVDWDAKFSELNATQARARKIALIVAGIVLAIVALFIWNWTTKLKAGLKPVMDPYSDVMDNKEEEAKQ